MCFFIININLISSQNCFYIQFAHNSGLIVRTDTFTQLTQDGFY